MKYQKSKGRNERKKYVCFSRIPNIRNFENKIFSPTQNIVQPNELLFGIG